MIDVSVAAAWFLKDEVSELADNALNCIETGEATLTVPALWHYELSNLLLVAERRGRLTAKEVEDARRIIDRLPHSTESPEPVSQERAYVLARDYRLSFYDALYLELAYRINAPLITADRELIRAARAINVSVEF